MGDETILEALVWVAMVLAFTLAFISTAAFGRQYADLEYQKEAEINGVRKIQSFINLRMHWNRIVLATVYIVTTLIFIADLSFTGRVWVSRILYIVLLLTFTVSALLDWMAERRQLKKLMNDPETYKLVSIRKEVHDVRESAHTVIALTDSLMKSPTQENEIGLAVEKLTKALDVLQTDVRSLDPNYRP